MKIISYESQMCRRRDILSRLTVITREKDIVARNVLKPGESYHTAKIKYDIITGFEVQDTKDGVFYPVYIIRRTGEYGRCNWYVVEMSSDIDFDLLKDSIYVWKQTGLPNYSEIAVLMSLPDATERVREAALKSEVPFQSAVDKRAQLRATKKRARKTAEHQTTTRTTIAIAAVICSSLVAAYLAITRV